MVWKIMLTLAALALWGGHFARADEHITPIAVDGDWAAYQHEDSMTDGPDVCVAGDSDSGFGIRADSGGVQLRMVNSSWTLPANVTGNIHLIINGNNYPLFVTFNTNNMVAAAISDDVLVAIAGDMNKSTSMTVTVGNAPPVQVSLSGSNTVMTAFLTCADIQPPSGTNGGPGSNPFQSAAPASQ